MITTANRKLRFYIFAVALSSSIGGKTNALEHKENEFGRSIEHNVFRNGSGKGFGNSKVEASKTLAMMAAETPDVMDRELTLDFMSSTLVARNSMSMSFFYSPIYSTEVPSMLTPAPTASLTPSNANTPVPTTPTFRPTKVYPSASLSSTPNPSVTIPSTSLMPAVVTDNPTELLLPSSTDSPSTSMPFPVSVFRCNESDVLEALDEIYSNYTSTIVQLQVRYQIEATADPQSFMPVINKLILAYAVIASTECSQTYLPPSKFQPLDMSTNVTGSCDAMYENATCFLMETDVSFAMDGGTTDTEIAAFLAYSSLQNDMKEFASLIRNVERVDYLSPSPIPVAGGSYEPPTTPDLAILNSDNPLSVSRWTIGAAVAMSTGGLMALVVWFRNRHTRNRRQVQLLDDVPLEPSVQQQQQRTFVTYA